MQAMYQCCCPKKKIRKAGSDTRNGGAVTILDRILPWRRRLAALEAELNAARVEATSQRIAAGFAKLSLEYLQDAVKAKQICECERHADMPTMELKRAGGFECVACVVEKLCPECRRKVRPSGRGS